jgi:hypothetical protein
MRQLLLLFLTLTVSNLYSQQIIIQTPDKVQVKVVILNEAAMRQLLTQFNGKQNDSLRKQWTARTFVLSNGEILIEFYDRQAALIDDLNDFKKLERVRFVKNNIGFLKKNISYKIEMSIEEGTGISKNEHPKRLDNLKSNMPKYFDFEVYELETGQILFLDKSKNQEKAAIYEDLKTLSSDYDGPIQELVYGSQNDEYLMKRLASGDALSDYEPNAQFLYPKYINDLIRNHRLTLIEKKVYVDQFYGNLYKSERGYYVLIDEVDQANGAGSKMQILTVRIYETLQQVRDAQKAYEKFKDAGVRSEHMYQKVSDKYGEKFSDFVPQLIDSLPLLLNFDKAQLSFDSVGIDLVDEAFKWNNANNRLFDTLFPSILAYYGHCYMTDKKDGKWLMYLDKESNVWIPEVMLNDGSPAWDWIDFYKDLFEGPTPLRWAGDWDVQRKEIRSRIKTKSGN